MRTLLIIFINLLLSAITILIPTFILWLDNFWLPPLPKLFEILAWPLFIFGAVLILTAVSTLIKHSGTSGAPGDPTKYLVTTGPYRWMRNPIYAGDALLLIGVAFFARSGIFLLVILAFLPCMDWFVRRVEEPRTEHRIGEEYTRYKQRVPRWIPKRLK